MGLPWKSMQREVILSPHVSELNEWGSIYHHRFYLGTENQRTYSQNNFWPSPWAGKLDMGGYFFTSRQTYESNDGLEKSRLRFWMQPYYFNGPLFAQAMSFDSNSFPVVEPTPFSTLNAAGTTAIARCLPTNPVAGLSTAIGEIKRDGLPLVPGIEYFKYALAKQNRPKSGRTRSRAAGSEFLNLEYAWKPTVSDIRKLAKAVKGSKTVLQQFEAGSGRNIRRRYVFPTTTSRSEVVLGERFPAGDIHGNEWNFLNPGIMTRTTTVKTERWFSGCFTYYLDVGTRAIDKLNRSVQMADKLLGIRLTPSVAWNIAPWSWAADWVANMGDIAHNVTAFSQDGLIMRYGYVMERKTSTDTWSLKGVSAKHGGYCPSSYQQTFVTVTKERRQATPFGFGLDVAGFTPRQWAIIGALGISRNPRRAM